MGFFEGFWLWVNRQLATYIGTNTVLVAEALEPAVISLATVYVMVWGYLQLTGRIAEPVAQGIRRIVVLTVVIGVGLHLWLYNSVLVDTFYSAPSQLAAAVVGGGDPVATIDAIWQQGGTVGEQLWNKGGILNGDIGFYLAGLMVWVFIGMLCVYAMFLIALSSIACSLLLAIGPLFIVMLLFDSTKRYFEAWIAQLANYALITILTVLVCALLLQIVESYAQQTAARGAALLTMDALDMVLMAGLVFLLMRQVMPIAAGLAAGPALEGFGAIGRLLRSSAGLGFAAAKSGIALARVAAIPRSPPTFAPNEPNTRGSQQGLSWREPT